MISFAMISTIRTNDRNFKLRIMEIEKGNTQSAQEDIYCTDLKDIHIDKE